MELGHECLFIGGAVAEQLAAVVWDAQAVDSTRDLDGNDGIIDSVFCPRIRVVIGEAPKRSMQCSVFFDLPDSQEVTCFAIFRDSIVFFPESYLKS